LRFFIKRLELGLNRENLGALTITDYSMPKSVEKKAVIDPKLPFEEALGRLEALIQGMDSEKMPLDDLIKNYEDGMSLYRVCEKRLDEAQGRIDMIRKRRDGMVALESFSENELDRTEESPGKKPPKLVEVMETNFKVEDGELF
jgi:exodeoxyribonuclease VII small subunit